MRKDEEEGQYVRRFNEREEGGYGIRHEEEKGYSGGWEGWGRMRVMGRNGGRGKRCFMTG
jgi:hypothetical protein